MGKSKKIGKDRKDPYYYKAKELNYRARSSFKLIQLNRQFNFLTDSKVLVDLCAAPGGWLQVAAEHMPAKSLIMGIDLCPIKPIQGCITFQDDITKQSCVDKIKGTLQHFKADCFLNDGAPNVGKNWLHDAYSQSVLTLHAMKLACIFLRKGGTFVTKVFRSKDYDKLQYVMRELFHNVHSTKPKASRNVSAEIFVVCQKFKWNSIKEIDRKFFDPRYVFEEVKEKVKPIQLRDFEPKKKKAKGYSDELQPVISNESTIDEFLQSENPMAFLHKPNLKVIVEESRLEELKLDHDMVECLKDVGQCSKKDIKTLLKWHTKMRKQLGIVVEEQEEEDQEEEEELDSDEEMVRELQKIEEEEARDLKQKQRAVRKAKIKITTRQSNLKHTGLVDDDNEMFSLQDVKTKSKLEKLDTAAMDVEHESPSEVEYDEDYSDSEEDYSDMDGDVSDDEENPLLVGETEEDPKWFQDKLFEDIEEEGEEDDVMQGDKYYQHKKEQLKEEEKKAKESNSNTAVKQKEPVPSENEAVDSDSDSEYEQVANYEFATELTPEELALGEELKKSQMRKNMIIDDSFNRNMHDDDKYAPDFFKEYEDKFVLRSGIDQHISKKSIAEYRKANKNLTDRTIKKVTEAKFRKKYHLQRKIERANKAASSIHDNKDMSNREKQIQLKSLYKKSGLSKKKEHTTYVFARKGMGQRVRRPAGVNGQFKVVDKRMKKELRAKKRAAKN